METNPSNRTYFWAKTTSDGKPGISVLEHLLNVGFVAQSLSSLNREQLQSFQLQSSLVGALAALHDLGKISPGFQMKCEEWLRQRGLLEIARLGRWDACMETDHGKVTHAALQRYFLDDKADEKTAEFLPTVIGGHHGRLNRPDERGYRPQKSSNEEHSGIDWDKERNETADAVFKEFGVHPREISIDESSPELWWIAGLTSVADWIGSDERYFPAPGGMDTASSARAAEKCLQEIGFLRPTIKSGLTYHDLFHDPEKADTFEPNNMQSAALKTITARGVYVIEAPMGMGKTEAALGAAYQLLAAGKASGIYFALPTQATSNRMHLRMRAFVERFSCDAVESNLIHSNSWLLNDRLPTPSPARTIDRNGEDAEIGRDWFCSSKRALIAPFGVGTVDQALLGVVAAKHFFVRHFALAGKVVILDEVHSYDLYTGTLIDKLIGTLEKLGCTVIVLSATLSKKRREEITPRTRTRTSVPVNEGYPLITGRRNGKALKPVAIRPPKPKTVTVDFKSEARALSLGLDAASKGACVVWVCDTVESAQEVYRHFRNKTDASFPLGLLHAHFPFWRREELENEWMDRLGKESSTRCGSILVSTQIVEQSVDLDADLMITDLAPTDMLLQRMGRLWRHDRMNRPVSEPRLIIINEEKTLTEYRMMKAKAIKESLSSKALVYEPYVLLRTLEEWKKLKQVTIPGDVRKIIESTYREMKAPKAWQKFLEDAEGKKYALKQKALMNTNIWGNPALPDDEGVQTRINDLPTLSLVLCRSITQNAAVVIDGTSCTLGTEEYQLATARAIHRNLVKIPQYLFQSTEDLPSIGRYVRGRYAVCRVDKSGRIMAKGLKDGVTLHWDIEFGLVIDKGMQEE